MARCQDRMAPVRCCIANASHQMLYYLVALRCSIGKVLASSSNNGCEMEKGIQKDNLFKTIDSLLRSFLLRFLAQQPPVQTTWLSNAVCSVR